MHIEVYSFKTLVGYFPSLQRVFSRRRQMHVWIWAIFAGSSWTRQIVFWRRALADGRFLQHLGDLWWARGAVVGMFTAKNSPIETHWNPCFEARPRTYHRWLDVMDRVCRSSSGFCRPQKLHLGCWSVEIFVDTVFRLDTVSRGCRPGSLSPINWPFFSGVKIIPNIMTWHWFFKIILPVEPVIFQLKRAFRATFNLRLFSATMTWDPRKLAKLKLLRCNNFEVHIVDMY